MPTAPRVSVLMPVYNAESYLVDAVESILCQTYTDYEFIIVDDGSTDRSLAISRRYGEKDTRIRLLSRLNTGMVGALNDGLSLARGEFVARMDADDCSLPDRFDRQVRYLEQNTGVVCVSGDYEYMDEKGRLLTVIHEPQDEAEIERYALAGIPPLCHGCIMARRAALSRIGGYDPAFPVAQDIDLYLRLGEVGRLANIPATLLRVRLHSRSAGARNRLLQHAKAREACERAYKRRGIVGQCEVGEPWRPGNDRESRHKFAMQCGWWAFNSGERRTAMIYGVKAMGLRPLSSDGWRLLACSVLKRPRAKSNA